MTRMLNDTIEYCQTRKAFGKKIIDNQVIHYRFAELLTEVEALRSLLYRIVGKCFVPFKNTLLEIRHLYILVLISD